MKIPLKKSGVNMILQLINILLVCFLLFSNLQAQSDGNFFSALNSKYYVKKSREFIINSDKINLLNHNFAVGMDTINGANWNNKFWFFFESSEGDEYQKVVNLFVYDYSVNYLRKVIDFPFSNTQYLQYTYFFDNFICILEYFRPTEEQEKLSLIVIDDTKFKITRIVDIAQNAWLVKHYSLNNELFIDVQPYIKKISWEYILSFWWPRGRPSKWKYEKDENPVTYVIDNNFRNKKII